MRIRINEYFNSNNISRYGNREMVLKSIVMLSAFLVPLIILNTGLVTTPLWVFILYIISGFGTAGVGMSVMHDALHGSYSKNRIVNKFMGYTMNLIGANATVWKIKHNVLHHTYTNIEESDEDISPPGFLRFSPHAKRKKLHKFQHIYAWFFYGISTISWVVASDFTRISRYNKMGLLKGKGTFKKEILKVIGWKIFYLSFSLILPLIIIPVSPWIIILAFLSMHFITGFCITIVFQAAHVVPDVEFPLPDENGNMEDDWAVHQLVTTSNFSPRSRIFSWFIGGLNYQVEHHLLPNVCHVHYKNLSSIVAETAREYGLPYNTKRTFINALWDHVLMLRQLGRMEMVSAKN